MTDTTGDNEFYTKITQRAYDMHIAYWIITRALTELLDPTKSQEFIDEVDHFGYNVDLQDTIFELVNSLYKYIAIENMEY